MGKTANFVLTAKGNSFTMTADDLSATESGDSHSQ